jgi:hypothetical protein
MPSDTTRTRSPVFSASIDASCTTTTRPPLSRRTDTSTPSRAVEPSSTAAPAIAPMIVPTIIPMTFASQLPPTKLPPTPPTNAPVDAPTPEREPPMRTGRSCST